MPLFQFECPDGVTIQAEECIKKCRMATRCMTRPSLYRLWKDSKDREATSWTEGGEYVPHITDLLQGTRAAFYKATKPYSVMPVDMGDLMLGVGTHAQLEEDAVALGDPTEVNLKLMANGDPNSDELPIAIGSADYLELIWDDNDLEAHYRLIDYKTYGLYLAGKLLGIKKKKLGGSWVGVEVDPDYSSVSMQANAYRIMLEDYGYRIREMVVQVIIKEGGFMFAQSGIPHKVMMVQIPMVKDSYVRQYLTIKSKMLKEAISNDEEPPVCTPEERWDDLKCKSYCEVWRHCAHGKLMRQVP